ncbi:MAG: hypothetical protein AAFR04_14495 [Pseudomonadota bacterium]
MQDERYSAPEFAALPQADDLRAYIEHGTPTNHFLTALLSNDLLATFGRADARSKAAIDDYVLWLRSYAPGHCYGSAERVEAWIAQGGLRGVASALGGDGGER